jgi:hypothetical protein
MTLVDSSEPSLPDDVVAALRLRALPTAGEAELRRALERYVPGYSLYRLTPAAVGIVYISQPPWGADCLHLWRRPRNPSLSAFRVARCLPRVPWCAHQ